MWSLRRQIAGRRAGETPTDAERRHLSDWLDAIEAHVRSGSDKQLPYARPLGPVDVPDAHRVALVAEMLIESGGAGVTHTLESLLAVVASCPSEELTPFWERSMPPRHAFGRRDVTASMRAELGGFALSWLAARGDVRARDAMLRVLPSLGPRDRGGLLLTGVLAAEALRRSSLWMSAARATAVDDPEFEGRYLARCALRAAGIRPQADAAGRFSFALRCQKFSCVIEVDSADSLEALHAAIQRALRWDDDHAWCFYLNARRRDSMFTWPDNEDLGGLQGMLLAEEVGDDDGIVGVTFADETPLGDVEPLPIQPEVIGEMGLRAGNKLLYHFDFGDDHLIPLTVKQIQATRGGRAAGTAVSAVKGTPPRQYG